MELAHLEKVEMFPKSSITGSTQHKHLKGTDGAIEEFTPNEMTLVDN
jgi:hypothetical protein